MAVAGGEGSSRPEGSQRAGCWSGGVGKVATSRPLARQSLPVATSHTAGSASKKRAAEER